MLDVYKTSSFIELLTLIQHSRNKGAGKFSYRQLADKLGYRSPRTLAMVHKGQRLPNHNLARKIANYYTLSPYEIELTFLFVEKAIAEKKQIDQIAIDGRIEPLKKVIERMKRPKSNLLSIKKYLHCHTQDLCQFVDQVESFLHQLAHQYQKIETESPKSEIEIKIDVDSS